MPETTTKPRWVECADKAADVLGAAREANPETGAKDATVREADAWMRLGYLYRDDGIQGEPAAPSNQ